MLAGDKAANLRFILIHASTNALTQRAIQRACIMLNKDKPTLWPGDRIDVDSEIGKALLGTPNGRAVAYLLSQHRETLVNVTIHQFTVFLMKSWEMSSQACFLFQLQLRKDSTAD